MSFIELITGEEHHFLKPFTPNINEIAFSLSHINRFNGHVGTYSVAQHSVLVASKLPKELKLAGLLHDATETYIGDVTSPLKKLLPEYKKIEEFYHDTIDKHFDVETRHPLIKEVDLRMLATEARDFGLKKVTKILSEKPFELHIERKSPELAYESFMAMFNGLYYER